MSKDRRPITILDIAKIRMFMSNVRSRLLDGEQFNLRKYEDTKNLRYSSYISSSMYATGYVLKRKINGEGPTWNPAKDRPCMIDAAKVLMYAIAWSNGLIDRYPKPTEVAMFLNRAKTESNSIYGKTIGTFKFTAKHVEATTEQAIGRGQRAKSLVPTHVSVSEMPDFALWEELNKRGYEVRRAPQKITITVTGPPKSGRSALIAMIKKELDKNPPVMIMGKIIEFEKVDTK